MWLRRRGVVAEELGGCSKKKKGKRKKLHQESHNNEKCDSLKLAQKLHHRESGMETMELYVSYVIISSWFSWGTVLGQGEGGSPKAKFSILFLIVSGETWTINHLDRSLCYWSSNESTSLLESVRRYRLNLNWCVLQLCDRYGCNKWIFSLVIWHLKKEEEEEVSYTIYRAQNVPFKWLV